MYVSSLLHPPFIPTGLYQEYIAYDDSLPPSSVIFDFFCVLDTFADKMTNTLDQETTISHATTLKALDAILHDFGLERSNGKSCIELRGSIPALEQTKSRHINMSLVGAVPALANAIAATQIFEARGGEPQTIAIDLQRSHNYLDPDIGMTPTINGQVVLQSANAVSLHMLKSS